MNQKGFTLIEVLAVIAIIAILGIVSTPGILNAINNSKKASYNILLDNIKTAGINLFEEIDLGNSLYHYDMKGIHEDNNVANIVTKMLDANSQQYYIEVNLQTLISNGFLKGINNENKDVNKNNSILLNPMTGEDIGECIIKITKKIESGTYKTTYEFEHIQGEDENKSCPKTEDLKDGV